MIYQVTIPNFENLRDEKIDQAREAVSSICDWNFRHAPAQEALELVSERINRTQLEQVVEALTKLSIQFISEDLSADYHLVATNAPEGYDYRGTSIYLGTDSSDPKTRHLAVLKSKFEFQEGRNASGLFFTRIIKGA